MMLSRLILSGALLWALPAAAGFPSGLYSACADLNPADADVLERAADATYEFHRRGESFPVPTASLCTLVAMDAIRITGGPDSLTRPENVERALERSYPTQLPGGQDR